jgi:hypothetical protein
MSDIRKAAKVLAQKFIKVIKDSEVPYETRREAETFWDLIDSGDVREKHFIDLLYDIPSVADAWMVNDDSDTEDKNRDELEDRVNELLERAGIIGKRAKQAADRVDWTLVMDAKEAIRYLVNEYGMRRIKIKDVIEEMERPPSGRNAKDIIHLGMAEYNSEYSPKAKLANRGDDMNKEAVAQELVKVAKDLVAADKLRVNDLVKIVGGNRKYRGKSAEIKTIVSERPPFHWRVVLEDGTESVFRGDELKLISHQLRRKFGTDLIAAETAMSEYKRQSGSVEKDLKIINDSWKKLKKGYEKQLKDDPTGWMGIGRGSELGDMVVKFGELADFMARYSKTF